MQLDEGKQKFIQSWGTLGSSWGISRTMAQVHALLLISKDPLCAEQIRGDLQISMGNANMNLRALLDWGLIYKKLKPGDRKEYFEAEKDMWEVVKCVIIHRKKKELEPMIKILDEIADVEGQCPDSDEFCNIIRDLRLFSNKTDSVLDKLIKADSNWFVGTFLNIIK